MLTDSQIKSAKPRERPYRQADSRGLRLNITPTGGKHWQLKYRLDKKEFIASLGSYPQVSLADARKRAESARELVAKGTHPLAHKKAVEAAKAAEALNTFGAVITAWIDANKNSWAAYTLSQVRSSMGRYLIENRALADKPIREVSSKDIRLVLQSIAKRTVLSPGERKSSGAVTIARNVRTWCRGVFAFAIERDLADSDPTWALRSLTELRRPIGSIKHNKKLSPKELEIVLPRIAGYTGIRQTGIALELLLLTFVRTSELTGARWEEVDLEARQWRIPASRMKARKPHLVPLSKQAIALLTEQQAIAMGSSWVFPNQRRADAQMSATTINRALERLQLNGPGTMGLAAHGFRGTASTHLHELGFPGTIIEIQLAHTERDQVKAAYNDAKYVDQRVMMMQAWADYLDGLRKT